jgi:hypothetical protein
MNPWWMLVGGFVIGFGFASILISRHARDMEADRDKIFQMFEKLREDYWRLKGDEFES